MTRDEALALVARERLLPFTDTEGARTSFVREIAGGAIRGSWWGHAKGHEIYDLAGAVARSGEAILVKLFAGKETFVHRKLWPAFARVVTDPAWRRERIAALSPPARKLLARVEKAGEVRVDLLSGKKPATKAERAQRAKNRRELESSLLVSADEVHTEKGHHACVLRTWNAWAKEKVGKEAGKLTLEAALSSLREASGEARSALDPLRARSRGGRASSRRSRASSGGAP